MFISMFIFTFTFMCFFIIILFCTLIYIHTHTLRPARLYYIPLYKNEELDLIFAYGVIKNKNKHINGMSIKEVIGMRLFVVYTGFIYLFIFKTYMCLKN